MHCVKFNTKTEEIMEDKKEKGDNKYHQLDVDDLPPVVRLLAGDSRLNQHLINLMLIQC